MNEHEYLLAWSVYIGAALGCVLLCFRLTAWMWRYLREILRLGVCVLLFSPTTVEPGQGLLAPSLAIIALDLLNVGDHTASAIWNLKLCALITFVLYLLWLLLWHFGKSLSGTAASRASRQEKQRTRQLHYLHEPQEPLHSPDDAPFGRVEPRL